MSYSELLNILKSDKEKNDRKSLLLKIINFLPGIRYRELLRLTQLNNGTLSYHLSALEKGSNIKVIRTNNSNITRYYPASISNDETIILGFLKIKTTKEIITKLLEKNGCTFNELVIHLGKAPSTTSWNLKRLIDSEVIIRKKGFEFSEYYLKNPNKVENLIKKSNTTMLDRSIDNYISLIENL